MATKKKRPTTRASAKKATPGAGKTAKKASAKKASAKKAVAKKAVAKKVVSKTANTAPRRTRSTRNVPVKKPSRSRDMPVGFEDWLLGSLTVVDGVPGVKTDDDFYPLEDLAELGEKVAPLLQLGPTRTGEMQETIRILLDFIDRRGLAAIGIIVRCCIRIDS